MLRFTEGVTPPDELEVTVPVTIHQDDLQVLGDVAIEHALRVTVTKVVASRKIIEADVEIGPGEGYASVAYVQHLLDRGGLRYSLAGRPKASAGR